jgi:uncharacterized membrane protein (DUF485 family)
MTDDGHVQTLARAHRRVAGAVIGAMLVLYFGLILLIALAKPLLGRVVVPGLSLAILLGAVVTVAAWLLTVMYVAWANRYYDHAARRGRS